MKRKTRPYPARRAMLDELFAQTPAASPLLPPKLASVFTDLDIESLVGTLEAAEAEMPLACCEARVEAAIRMNATIRRYHRDVGALPPIDALRLAAALQSVELLYGQGRPAAERLRSAIAVYEMAPTPAARAA